MGNLSPPPPPPPFASNLCTLPCILKVCVLTSNTDTIPLQTGDVASKMDDTQLKTDNEPSQSDGALPVKDDVHSAREDDKLLLKENDSPSTCMTTNGTGGGTPMTGGVHSTTERMPSVTTCGTTAANPKPSSDMQKSVPGDECATPKSKNAMPNTDDGCVPGKSAPGTNCQTTQKGISAISVDYVHLLNLSVFSIHPQHSHYCCR